MTVRLEAERPDMAVRARMSFFTLLGRTFPRLLSADRHGDSRVAEKKIWSQASGSIVQETYITGLLAALSGWAIAALWLSKVCGVSAIWASLLAFPVSFIAWHVVAIIASMLVGVCFSESEFPMAWSHRMLVTGLTLSCLFVAGSCPAVWPWLLWMALNAAAWFVLTLFELFAAMRDVTE